MSTHPASPGALTPFHALDRLGVLLAALQLGACSTSPSASPLEQACSDYAQIYRAREQACYGVAPEPDESTLLSREVTSCVAFTSAPGSELDATYWEQCATLADNDCGGYDCGYYPPGIRAAGEPCLVSTQCTSLWCKGTVVIGQDGGALPGATSCGTCAARIADGQPCDATTDACEEGSSCFAGACRARGAEGASCALTMDCTQAYVCRSSNTCGFYTEDASPCSGSADCGPTTGCDPVTKLCEPAQFGQPGAACDGIVDRCENGYCDKTLGVCPKVLPDGEACDPTDASEVCDDYAQCFEGTCQIPDPKTCM